MTLEAYRLGNWRTVAEAYCPDSELVDDHLRGVIAMLQASTNMESVTSALRSAKQCGASPQACQDTVHRSIKIDVANSLALLGSVESAIRLLEPEFGSDVAKLQLGHILLKAGEWQTADQLISDALKRRNLNGEGCQIDEDGILARVMAAGSGETQIAAGADGDAVGALLAQAAVLCFDDLPRQLLVESRSLPRSGHHYLKSVFQKGYGDYFSYCESYQEPGCCKRQPCGVRAFGAYARSRGEPHVRFIKSHDFNLQDPIFSAVPGYVRLVQVRRPFNLLASWLELDQLSLNQKFLADNGIGLQRVYLYHEVQLLKEAWRLIDDAGEVMSEEKVQEWLLTKEQYVTAFVDKWLPVCVALPRDRCPIDGSFLLRYEDLGWAAELLMTLLGGSAGGGLPIPFTPKEGRLMERPSLKVSALLRDVEPLIAKSESRIFAACPDYLDLYV